MLANGVSITQMQSLMAGGAYEEESEPRTCQEGPGVEAL